MRYSKGVIKEEFPVNEEVESHLNPLTPEEENALRYVAGYVCRTVEDKIQQCKYGEKEKESMVRSLKEMTIGDVDDNSGAWLKMIDQGGLWHINDKVYAVFTIMEEHTRYHYSNMCSEDSK